MATDQKTSILTPEPEAPVIENELPTYRAISTRAVLSLLCGLFSPLAFADNYFYLLAALAVVLGVTAIRNIKRYPDMLTGTRIAQAGAGLGLAFGLGIATVSFVQGFVVKREASVFATQYAEMIKNGSLGEALWIGMPPSARKGSTPDQLLEQFQNSKKQDSQMLDVKIGPIKAIKARLASSKDEEIHFVSLEQAGSEGLNAVALALFELHGPGSKDFPEKEQFALALMKGTPQGRSYEWWVDEVRFPYKPATYVMPSKAVDDGHGHAH